MHTCRWRRHGTHQPGYYLLLLLSTICMCTRAAAGRTEDQRGSQPLQHSQHKQNRGGLHQQRHMQQAVDLPPQSEPWSNPHLRGIPELQGVNLIVMFNWPAKPAVVDIIQTFYGPVFGKVVLTGGVRPEGIPADVHWVDCDEEEHQKGHFMYVCHAKAIQQHPAQTGYLIVGDDVVINPCAILGKLQLGGGPKFWLPTKTAVDMLEMWLRMPQKRGSNHFDDLTQIHALSLMDVIAPEHASGHLWNRWQPHRPYGLHATLTALKTLPPPYKLAANATLGLVDEHGNENGAEPLALWNMQYIDAYYVPHEPRFVEHFVELSAHFRQHSSWCEVAIPQIINLVLAIMQVSVKDGLDPIDVHYLWFHERGGTHGSPFFQPWQPYADKQYIGLHPLKLSDQRSVEHISRWWSGLECPHVS